MRNVESTKTSPEPELEPDSEQGIEPELEPDSEPEFKRADPGKALEEFAALMSERTTLGRPTKYGSHPDSRDEELEKEMLAAIHEKYNIPGDKNNGFSTILEGILEDLKGAQPSPAPTVLDRIHKIDEHLSTLSPKQLDQVRVRAEKYHQMKQVEKGEQAKKEAHRAALKRKQEVMHELSTLKLSDLRKRAQAEGVSEDQLEDAYDEDNIRGAVVKLIFDVRSKTDSGQRGAGLKRKRKHKKRRKSKKHKSKNKSKKKTKRKK
jgi:hypothetical protein